VADVNQRIRDLIIIGSGPAGYTAAVYAARAHLAPLVFEGSQYGGALMTTTDVENYPGFSDAIMGPDLMEQMRLQAERFGADLQVHDVESVDLTGDVKTVTVDGIVYRSRGVVLPMGAEPRYLWVPGERELLGRGVSSCATCGGFFFRDQDIAVIGGGDSAMEEATFLTRFARSVTIVHRRDEFRASRSGMPRSPTRSRTGGSGGGRSSRPAFRTSGRSFSRRRPAGAARRSGSGWPTDRRAERPGRPWPGSPGRSRTSRCARTCAA
jgi:thioredoxin reductase (NADPH)